MAIAEILGLKKDRAVRYGVVGLGRRESSGSNSAQPGPVGLTPRRLRS
jgi:hypothetical protein